MDGSDIHGTQIHHKNQRIKYRQRHMVSTPLNLRKWISSQPTLHTTLHFNILLPRILCNNTSGTIFESASPKAPVQGIGLRHVLIHLTISSGPNTETCPWSRWKRNVYAWNMAAIPRKILADWICWLQVTKVLHNCSLIRKKFCFYNIQAIWSIKKICCVLFCL